MKLDKLKSFIKNPKSLFYTKDEQNTFVVVDWFAGLEPFKKQYTSLQILDLCATIEDPYAWYHTTFLPKDRPKKIAAYTRDSQHPDRLLKILFLEAFNSTSPVFIDKALLILKNKLKESYKYGSELALAQSMNTKYLTITNCSINEKMFNLAPSDPRLAWIKELINLELTLYLKEKQDLTNLIFKMYLSASPLEKKFIEDILASVWDIKVPYKCLNYLEISRYAKNQTIEIDYDWDCDLDLVELFTNYPVLAQKIIKQTLSNKGLPYLNECIETILKKHGHSDTVDSLKSVIEKINLEENLILPPINPSPSSLVAASKHKI